MKYKKSIWIIAILLLSLTASGSMFQKDLISSTYIIQNEGGEATIPNPLYVNTSKQSFSYCLTGNSLASDSYGQVGDVPFTCSGTACIQTPYSGHINSMTVTGYSSAVCTGSWTSRARINGANVPNLHVVTTFFLQSGKWERDVAIDDYPFNNAATLSVYFDETSNGCIMSFSACIHGYYDTV